MLITTRPRRDPFAFSTGGMVAINSYAFIPAIPDDVINKALDARFAKLEETSEEPSPLVHKIENVLARFFVPGFST
ncbi:MAG: hypothetical protein V2I25_14725 [Woeseiaceae bacterium]|jgi:hypothetical protein|nr:hypothetical protein [Woeseiaceae bacterium]